MSILIPVLSIVSGLHGENVFGEWMSNCVLEAPWFLPRTEMPSAMAACSDQPGGCPCWESVAEFTCLRARVSFLSSGNYFVSLALSLWFWLKW